MSTLTIKSVKCIRPSSGIDDTARSIFGAIGAAAGGGAAFAGATVTGGALAATVGIAATGGAAAGVAVIDTLDRFFSGADDLYIKVNGNKVWPSRKYEGINSQQSKDINVSVPFDQRVKIELWEYDTVSSDDLLGYLDFNGPTQSSEGKFVVSNEGEGSIYELDVRIDV